ncbi:FumA C-terminus/TtdB family hydratase beta subunit [Thermococcus thioreducens]|uniref:Fumarase, class I beta subunit n=1 Tax=Thermococcus thioreducens TaxID=277988 RepID=A0A0Q2M5I0_9EURY|nr:FumA C-terminus/TtdB family hydratase beta subunit [Thermococcus thioreducens]ASJ13282.1 fumarate hydratase [Thermococcus thioreducens]KQH83305.1 fumarate hydratase [Thermococcus thioreducens]SEW22049.1 fumarase, class I beta subunit [Thermococcus thioreducens]
MAVRLKTPLSGDDILNLNAGDVVHLSGVIYTARDSAHSRILKLVGKGELPFDLNGAVIYHCGPVVRKTSNGYGILSAGPTTSARMNRYLDKILSLGVRGIIGKGGMNREPFKDRAVYFSFTGGAGSLAAKSVKRVVDVLWLEELGIPEAVWVLEVEDFPLLVAIDANGSSLYGR